MAIRPVLKMGDPVLLQVAKPVERFDTPELRELLQDMKDTMASLTGAGLCGLSVCRSTLSSARESVLAELYAGIMTDTGASIR